MQHSHANRVLAVLISMNCKLNEILGRVEFPKPYNPVWKDDDSCNHRWGMK